MKWILFFSLVLTACANKSVRQIHDELYAAPANRILAYENIDLAQSAKVLINEKDNSFTLEPVDPIVGTGGKTRSHFKVFRLPTTKSDLFLEVHSMPYRPAGFGGEFRIIEPQLVFFDTKGKQVHPPPAEIMKQQAQTFVKGKFLRTVWKLPAKSQAVYAVLTAKQENIGKNAMQVTNYGGAAIGFTYDETVVISPTGWVYVFPTINLKK